MKFNMTQLTASASLAAAAILAGCGGGEGGSEAAASGTSATTTPETTANVFATQQATYTLPCRNTTYGLTGPNESDQHVIKVEGLVGSDTVKVSVQVQAFSSPRSDPAGAACQSSALVWDGSFTGQMRDTGVTKSYTLKEGGTVDLRVVEGTLGGFSMKLGTLRANFPLPGATAKAAYRVEGDKVYYGVGARGSDGVEKDVGVVTVTKQ